MKKKKSFILERERHTNWRNEWGNVTQVLCTCRWSGHILFDTNTKTGLNNVTVSLSCVTVAEAPGNVSDNKNRQSETMQNKQRKTERKNEMSNLN